eukprot:TRINITY_DN36280_c0_g1_i2.p1 TRINITY_DN36280_c0_g1~~TRINITY_DN36280_c0_g1_i2.p1  ORF type:complete len:314 (-),score=55.78 TRINITY_DN36280_c0_g1_i2:287-1123(-)
MVSLNDLEAQIAALGDEADSCDESGGSSSKPPPPKKKKKPKKKAKAKAGKKRPRSASSADEAASSAADPSSASEDADAGASAGQQGAGEKKKKRRRGVSIAVCFRYLAGKCAFDDCQFRHVKASKLETEEQAQMLKELPQRKFDPEVAEVLRQLNIPKCRDFHQKGTCPRPAGKCHYWHLADAVIARWAGFPFWCDTCKKGLSSEQQVEDHGKSKAHREAASEGPVGRGGRGSDRGRGGGRGRGPSTGRGRGYADTALSPSGDTGPGRARGRGGRGYY